MQPPLGQGAMFQIYFRDVGSIWPISLPEIGRSTSVHAKSGAKQATVESGQQEVFVQDPDGYLLMLAQSFGERAPARPEI